jgi:hydrogenase/urease accessory protein HupE
VAPEAEQGGVAVTGAYVALGVEHILGGLDHLLFVFALLLLVGGGAPLVKTVTAFTLAHSVTLALSVTGLVRLPGPPVEAAIALSIVFVAAELARAVAPPGRGRGRRGAARVAFAFGLLHGFGFAGALRGVGLPQEHLATALLSFNLGVELGQLLFVSVLLAAGATMARLIPVLSDRRALLARLTAYGVGALATAWTIERVVAFWSTGGGA